jgi:hypothetical protein
MFADYTSNLKDNSAEVRFHTQPCRTVRKISFQFMKVINDQAAPSEINQTSCAECISALGGWNPHDSDFDGFDLEVKWIEEDSVDESMTDDNSSVKTYASLLVINSPT